MRAITPREDDTSAKSIVQPARSSGSVGRRSRRTCTRPPRSLSRPTRYTGCFRKESLENIFEPQTSPRVGISETKGTDGTCIASTSRASGARVQRMYVAAGTAPADSVCVFLKPLGPIPRSSVRWSPRSGHGSRIRGLILHVLLTYGPLPVGVRSARACNVRSTAVRSRAASLSPYITTHHEPPIL